MSTEQRQDVTISMKDEKKIAVIEKTFFRGEYNNCQKENTNLRKQFVLSYYYEYNTERIALRNRSKMP